MDINLVSLELAPGRSQFTADSSLRHNLPKIWSQSAVLCRIYKVQLEQWWWLHSPKSAVTCQNVSIKPSPFGISCTTNRLSLYGVRDEARGQLDTDTRSCMPFAACSPASRRTVWLYQKHEICSMGCSDVLFYCKFVIDFWDWHRVGPERWPWGAVELGRL